MKKIVFITLLISIVFCFSCKRPDWATRYKSEGCLTLEYVEFYQDGTADIKYFGSKTPTNHKLNIKDSMFYANIYVFQLREDGKMYEMGGYDVGCVMVKDKDYGFWDKVLKP